MHTSLGGGGGVGRVRAHPPPPPPPPPPPQAQRSTFLFINDLKPIELIVFFNFNSLTVF